MERSGGHSNGITADEILAKHKLTVQPVTSATWAEGLRQVRNACRDGFAHHNAEITEAEQAAWWEANCDHVKAWLYFEQDPPNRLLAFTMARFHEGHWWSTAAVHPDGRGRSLGKAVTAHLVRVAGVSMIGEARVDNPAACALHTPDDWEEVRSHDSRLRRYITRAVLNVETWPPPQSHIG